MRYKSSQTKLIHGALCFFSVQSIPGDLHDNKDIFLNLLAHVMAASVSYVWQHIYYFSSSLSSPLHMFAYAAIDIIFTMHSYVFTVLEQSLLVVIKWQSHE